MTTSNRPPETGMRPREIRGFAKHYAIPLGLAREVCQAGGNWAKAVDILINRVKTQQEGAK